MAGSPEAAPIKAAELLDRLALQVRRTLRTADAVQVHRLRVAIRRFRQALAVVEDRAAPAGIKNIHRRLKKTMALAGDVRDCDVTGKLVSKLQAPTSLHAKLQLRREQARRLLLAALRHWLDRETDVRWRAKIAGFGSPGGDAPAGVLLKAAKRLFKRGRKIRESTDALHRLRIAAKKLRYTMEVAGHADAACLDQIETLQKHLGDISDYETARRVVAGEPAGKRISPLLKEHQRKKIRAFRHYWNGVFAGKESEWVKALTHARE
jgi:CHAD domain-containing protein